MHEAAARSGVAPDAIENLQASAGRAGFKIVGTNGFFNVMEPSVGFDIHASAVAAIKAGWWAPVRRLSRKSTASKDPCARARPMNTDG